MFSLSKESEFELSHALLDLVDNFLKSKSQPEQRLLLRLYYVRALPNWDVAEKIDTSVPTMYRILRKGKERLAKIL